MKEIKTEEMVNHIKIFKDLTDNGMITETHFTIMADLMYSLVKKIERIEIDQHNRWPI